MFKDIENLKLITITSGTAKHRHSFVTCRKYNSFLLRLTGCTRYAFDGFHIDLHPGEIAYLPKGASYEFSTLTNSPCNYVSVSFDGDTDDAAPSSYSFDGFRDADEFTNSLYSMWNFGNKSEKYRCYAIFYSLLSYLEGLENQDYVDKGKFSIISPAVSYIKTHIYDSNLNIETLYKLCGISGTYFRDIFEDHYGISPQKYICARRLSHAKALIDSGDYGSVSELAVSVGYSDPLYFSRAFKKKYGMSPLQYAKE